MRPKSLKVSKKLSEMLEKILYYTYNYKSKIIRGRKDVQNKK